MDRHITATQHHVASTRVELELVADGHPRQCRCGRRYASLDGRAEFCDSEWKLCSVLAAEQQEWRREQQSDQW